MNSKPKVTVFIPTYNRPQLVINAIKSVLIQSYKDFELLIIDDSEDDATKKVVDGIKDPRISYIHGSKRFGLIESRNEAVRRSNPYSIYIAPLDDDDAYLPNYLERTVAFMDDHPKCMAICTDSEVRRQDGSLVRIDHCERKKFWHVSFGNGCLIRKDVFTKLNIWWDPSVLFEDLDFGVRIAKDNGWDGVPEVLRIYNAYPGVGDTTAHATHARSQPQEKIENFLVKHYDTYASAGPEALAWILNTTGKMLVRNGYLKAGRADLYKALRYKAKPVYVVDYLVSIFAPGFFNNLSIMVLKNKIRGILAK